MKSPISLDQTGLAQTGLTQTGLLAGLSTTDLGETADFIAACQLPSGMILWHEGGHADVWNHTEAAMALAVAGSATDNRVYTAAAAKAFDWLIGSQLSDGSWHSYYVAPSPAQEATTQKAPAQEATTQEEIEDPKIDTNCCAYPAVGVWHYYLSTGDRNFLEAMWPVIDQALNFVVGLSRPDHHIPWAVHSDGTRWSYSLLTGTCSIVMSLEAGLLAAAELDHTRPHWKLALKRLRRLIKHNPESFEPKHRWAMDWYYPVLCGAVTGVAAAKHLAKQADKFITDHNADDVLSGVRCVHDKPWVTAAETCECALAYLRAGEPEIAQRLFSTTNDMRDSDGAYFTGLVLPEEKTFPHVERTSYTAAAVLLAADALAELSPAAGLLSSSSQAASQAITVQLARTQHPQAAHRRNLAKTIV